MTNITRQNALLARHNRYILTDGNDTRRKAIIAIYSVGCLVGTMYAAKKLSEPIKPQDAIIAAVVIGVLIGRFIMELLNNRRNETNNQLLPLVNRPLRYHGFDIQNAVQQAAYGTMPTGAAAA